MSLAWSKQERAGLSLEQTLAALAPIALLALDLTARPVPAPLAALAEATRAHVPIDQQGLMLGPATAELAAWLRGRLYLGGTCSNPASLSSRRQQDHAGKSLPRPAPSAIAASWRKKSF